MVQFPHLVERHFELVEIRRPVLAHLQSELLRGVRASALTSFTTHAPNQKCVEETCCHFWLFCLLTFDLWLFLFSCDLHDKNRLIIKCRLSKLVDVLEYLGNDIRSRSMGV
jgi:hypothetical protein